MVWDDFINIEIECDKAIYNLDAPSQTVIKNRLRDYRNNLQNHKHNFAFGAYYIFGSIKAIAASVLLSYCLWYYLCQVYIYKTERWKIPSSIFYDIALVALFVAMVMIINSFISNIYISAAVEFGALSLSCALIYLIKREQINASVHEFSFLLRD